MSVEDVRLSAGITIGTNKSQEDYERAMAFIVNKLEEIATELSTSGYDIKMTIIHGAKTTIKRKAWRIKI